MADILQATSLLQEVLRGKDLKDFKVIPNSQLRENLSKNDQDSAGTNLITTTPSAKSTALTHN